jgi:tRNA dimethylallyltransferase
MLPNSILVLLGPTASGKSDLAVRIAKESDNLGEVVSADSRQVYRGLNIGTGKITKKEMLGIPHHLLDVANPKKKFSVVDYQTLAREKISEIFSRGHLPIICGGTGFYIECLVNNSILPNVSPNERLRSGLKSKTAEALMKILKKLDPKRAQTIDAKNPRRIIRAIEIARAIGKVPPIKNSSDYEILKIGIKTDPAGMKEKIGKRLDSRLKKGLIAEAKKLHKNGLSWKRMEELGLEYRYLALHLQGKISKKEMIHKLKTEIWRYSKRQMTWWKRDSDIKWFPLAEREKIFEVVGKFFKN